MLKPIFLGVASGIVFTRVSSRTSERSLPSGECEGPAPLLSGRSYRLYFPEARTA